MRRKHFTTGCLALLLSASATFEASQSTETVELYACDSPAEAEAQPVGVAVCDAAATSELALRAETDNLQVREGALVVEVEPSGVAGVSGLQVGDVIYRVGGVDVASAKSAAERLTGVGTESDTVVNFLRGGRPYRVKLRLH